MAVRTTHDGCVTPETYPTAIQIKSAIPGRFFKSDLITSFFYVAKDAMILISLYITMRCLEIILPWFFLAVLFPVYWLFQGTMFWAIFVIGHDCGHGSFSRYDVINDIVGTCLHTFVLTPFYPWKLSHRNHHKYTGNIDKDEVFYPVRESDHDGKGLLQMFGLGFGWFIYLAKGYNPRGLCHFNPYNSMFVNHVTGCYISIISLFVWSGVLLSYAGVYGGLNLVKYYVMPEIIFATWLLIVTFLHHTDVNVPWYSDDNWTFVKGQLSSIDRNYGWAHALTHNIGTHQIHHLFSKIPHYHLEEATVHFRNSFPELVRTNEDGILFTFVKLFRKFSQQYIIPDDTNIHVFH